MFLKIRFNLFLIFKLTLLIISTHVSNLYAHNFLNGGCKEHCVQKFGLNNNKNVLQNKDQIDMENENSCLNKSLCRG